jgi:hypothetical protein
VHPASEPASAAPPVPVPPVPAPPVPLLLEVVELVVLELVGLVLLELVELVLLELVELVLLELVELVLLELVVEAPPVLVAPPAPPVPPAPGIMLRSTEAISSQPIIAVASDEMTSPKKIHPRGRTKLIPAAYMESSARFHGFVRAPDLRGGARRDQTKVTRPSTAASMPSGSERHMAWTALSPSTFVHPCSGASPVAYR